MLSLTEQRVPKVMEVSPQPGAVDDERMGVPAVGADVGGEAALDVRRHLTVAAAKDAAQAGQAGAELAAELLLKGSEYFF